MRKYSKISKREREELLEEFCEALSVLKEPQEIMRFIVDLFTREEIIMLAKRIKVAKLLIEGKNYREIEGLLKVGHSTVARVSQWLTEGGEGFKLIAERTKKEKLKPPSSWDLAIEEWKRSQRRYPLLFWPQLLIEDIIKMMNKKQKERLRQAISKLDHKSNIYKQINKMFKT